MAGLNPGSGSTANIQQFGSLKIVRESFRLRCFPNVQGVMFLFFISALTDRNRIGAVQSEAVSPARRPSSYVRWLDSTLIMMSTFLQHGVLRRDCASLYSVIL